jgi:hypothetical protein
MYSLPIAATTLTCYMVETPTVGGEEYMYMVIQDPDEGNHPGFQGVMWCNEDAEGDDDEMSDESWDVTEVDMYTHAEADPIIIQACFKRLHGDDCRLDLENKRVYFPSFDYVWLPWGLTNPEDEGYDTLDEYIKEESIDLQQH